MSLPALLLLALVGWLLSALLLILVRRRRGCRR